MAATDHLNPSQFSSLHALDEGFEEYGGTGISDVADILYSREPKFMATLENSIRRRGVQDPVDVVPEGDRNMIYDGHHRAAAAYRAGVSLPITTEAIPRTDTVRARDYHWNQVRNRWPEERDARESFGEAWDTE
jgi:hypothetical protein